MNVFPSNVPLIKTIALHTSSGAYIIKATCEKETLRVPYDYALDLGQNHEAAAKEMFEKLGFPEGLDAITSPLDENSRVFLFWSI